MKKNKGIVLIPDGYKPSDDELWAARIIVKEYGARVEFQAPDARYGIHTADIHIDGISHEIKTPESNKPESVYRLLSSGAKQADILIVNARKTSLSADRLKRIAQRVIAKKRNVYEIIIIDKQGHLEKITH